MKLVISEDNIDKAFGLPEGVDPTHKYVYRSGSHGIYDFWYKDRFLNYWQYTNAPEHHPDYDPLSGNAILVADQVMPNLAPQFYTEDGRKLHASLPIDTELLRNEAYDPMNPSSIWYGMYEVEDGSVRFMYLDSDIRENLDLWVQYNLRTTDSGLVRYRKYAAKLLQSAHPKDRVVALILMLVDQGMYDMYELLTATVADVEYVDSTVIFLGKKIVLDVVLLDLFTSLTTGRDGEEPLFMLGTRMGQQPIGPRHMQSIFSALRISPAYLLFWHVSHLYSKIVHRLAANAVDIKDFHEMALIEVGNVLGTPDDISHLVDLQLQRVLKQNYREEDEPPMLDEPEEDTAPEGDEEEPPPPDEVGKSLTKINPDPFGVLTVWADLTAKRPDEMDFSKWLHSMPLHEVTEAELEDLLQPTEPTEDELAEDQQAETEQESGSSEDDPQLPEADE